MVEVCRVALRLFFAPSTRGSHRGRNPSQPESRDAKARGRRRCSPSGNVRREWQRRSWPHAVVTRRTQGSSGHRLCHSSVTRTMHRSAPHFAPVTRIPLRATLRTSTTGCYGFFLIFAEMYCLWLRPSEEEMDRNSSNSGCFSPPSAAATPKSKSSNSVRAS